MPDQDIYQRSLEHHRKSRGKLEIRSLMRLDSQEDLSLAYTPGVARPCEVISKNAGAAWDLTWKGRVVAVVSDGSAILGLGNLGALASLPVMEGKAALFKEFAGVEAVPIILDTQDVDEIVATVRNIAPSFGGINLEDISAPRCFEVEAQLQNIGIPVLHDDQHGTAIVLLAALRNAARVVGKPFAQLSVVISGAGAAGRAIVHLLACTEGDDRCIPVKRLRICDSKGIVAPHNKFNNSVKEELALLTNPEGEQGSLQDALKGADVFIGVSRGGLLNAADIATMAPDAIVLAMANPEPEIHPAEAKEGGAAIVGTGRSDYPNQVNNVLAFPGLFRGALEARATRFTNGMKFAAIDAISNAVKSPNAECILPSPFDRSVAVAVAREVAAAAIRDGVCHDGA
ncbi:MAG: malate dehydrogenase (oxaloacetate-decarboxylating) [Planctomycetota bacterium]|jgi:malate dehydrogenase (oxaloacetate-decarboxylating)